ncbi:hypothetical protein FSP39_016109 [Pinctada imbricata]|uniref:Uncharacterized protein n=1 Tax=Pinctada imbricata TaxID=66713 RepID=A0AA88XJ43_PINIB|nr:hypothetical protein FSP39_016109 [Pinctada imbricata]
MNSSGNDSSYGADAQFQSYNQNYVTPMGQVGFRGPVPGSGMSTMPNMPNTPLQGIVAQGVARVSTPINPAQSQNQVPFLPEYDIQRIALALENLLTEKLNARIDERITPLVECIDRLSIENKELHMKLDELEMYSRKSCVRIFGVPESKTDCDSAVMEIAEKLQVPLAPTEIAVSHRVGKVSPSKPRPIIARITNYHLRHRLIKESKNLSKVEGMRGVSVNQELTKKRSKLAYEARQMVKAGVIKSTFIWDGKIFLVDKQEKKHLVTSLDKLIEVQNYLAPAIQPGHPPVSNT